LAFVSDVRAAVRQTPAQKELTIASDMADQAGWVQRLGVQYYSLKLRLPFTMTPEIYAKYADVCRAFGQIPADGGTTDTQLPYLSGRCVLQKYARNMSTEMRLMGFEKAHVTWYDIHRIETTFFPFNTVHRGNTRFEIGPIAQNLDRLAIESLARDVWRHARAIASRKSHVSYDEIGEALVLGEAACIASTMFDPQPNPSKSFDTLVGGFSSLFEGRRSRA
jgi:hypothetical protein